MTTEIQTLQHTASQLAEAVSEQQIQLSEKVGALKATNFIKKLVTVTEIKLIAEIKETKQYKGLTIIDPTGLPVTVTTFQEFCQALGHSYEKVNQDLQNLSAFGEDFLETSQRMGLGYRDLRKLRQLPAEEQQLIINGEAVKTEDKESLIDMIEEMAVKHAKEKADRDEQIKQLQADNLAKDSVLANKDKKINELDKKLNLRRQPEQALLAQQELEQHIMNELQIASKHVLTAVSQFNTAVITLKSQAEDELPQMMDKIEQELDFIYSRIAELATAEGVEIHLAEMMTPAWAVPTQDNATSDEQPDFELRGQTQEELAQMYAKG